MGKKNQGKYEYSVQPEQSGSVSSSRSTSSPRNLLLTSSQKIQGWPCTLKKKTREPAPSGSGQQEFQQQRNGIIENIKKRRRNGIIGISREISQIRFLDRANTSRVALADMESKSRLVLDAESPYIRNWGLVVLSALFFTTVLAPLEVVFLQIQLDALFFINRLIDLIFFVDMVINFFLAYWKSDGVAAGGDWVTDLRKIQIHYLKHWFLLDVLSTFPFDVLVLILKNSSSLSSVRIIRIIRLFRLLKLFRIFKAANIAGRFQHMIPTSTRTGLKIVASLLIGNHWIACLWSWIGIYYYDIGQINWISTHFSSTSFNPENSIFRIYSEATYFGAMTVYTIGYGNIVPMNMGERWVCVVIMLAGSCLWAYALGTAGGFSLLDDLKENDYQQMLDTITGFAKDQRMLQKEQVKLRKYFKNLWYLDLYRKEARLAQTLSPELGKTLSLQTSPWVKNLLWYKNTSKQFLASVAQNMNCGVFCPYETMPSIDHLCVVGKGVIAKGRLMSKGAIYGEDILLNSIFLKDKTRAVSLGHTELLFINRNDLKEILCLFPNDKKSIRRCTIWIAIRRAVKLVSFFSKQGWQFEAKSGVPYASEWKLENEMKEKYQAFVQRLHPRLAIELANQMTYEIELIMDLTEHAEEQQIPDIQNMLGQHVHKRRHRCTNSHIDVYKDILSIEAQLNATEILLRKMDDNLDFVLEAITDSVLTAHKQEQSALSLMEMTSTMGVPSMLSSCDPNFPTKLKNDQTPTNQTENVSWPEDFCAQSTKRDSTSSLQNPEM